MKAFYCSENIKSIFVLLMVSFAVSLVMPSYSAVAVTNNKANFPEIPILRSMRAYGQDNNGITPAEDRGKKCGTFGHAQPAWISLRGNTLATTTTIEADSSGRLPSTLDLQFNGAGAYCNSLINGTTGKIEDYSDIRMTRWKVIRYTSSHGSIDWPAANNILDINYAGAKAANNRYTSIGSKGFTLKDINDSWFGDDDEVTIKVNVWLKALNRFGGNNFLCVADQKPLTAFEVDQCPESPSPLSVNLTIKRNNSWCSITVPSTVAPGSRFSATFKVHNNGEIPNNPNWNVFENAMKLGSLDPKDNMRFGANRITLPPTYAFIIQSGRTVTVTQSFTAPNTAGSHNFSWGLVKEGVAWYDKFVNCNKSIEVRNGFIHNIDYNPTPVNPSGDFDYPSGGVVEPGKSYSVGIRGWNRGNKIGESATMVVRNVNPDLVSSAGSTPVEPDTYRRTGYGFHNFYVSDDDNKNLTNGINAQCSGDNVDRNYACWIWYVHKLPPLGDKGSNTHAARATFDFEVSDSAKHGDKVCFDIHIIPRTSWDSSYQRPGNGEHRLCFDVVNPRKPEVRVKESDVHAGAALSLTSNADCTTKELDDVGSNDNIEVNNANSKGQYAVSATGNISDKFGSNNNSGDSSLKFNNQPMRGSYMPVCRPDFSKLEPSITRSPSTINTSSLVDNAVIKYTGSVNIRDITLPDGMNTTIIVDGDVRIHDTIQQPDRYNDRSSIPSLAIIATGNIQIEPTVSRLDGLYVAIGNKNEKSYGYIDTCFHSTSYSNSSVCTANNLTVNGAVVAKQILLHRKGNSSSSVGETFSFLPELYLAPPPSTGNTLSIIKNSQSDLPPVF